MPQEEVRIKEWEKAPLGKMLMILAVIALVGGGWWYFSKKSTCEQKITYRPASETPDVFGRGTNKYGERYELCNGKDCKNFESRTAAISACIW